MRKSQHKSLVLVFECCAMFAPFSGDSGQRYTGLVDPVRPALQGRHKDRKAAGSGTGQREGLKRVKGGQGPGGPVGG